MADQKKNKWKQDGKPVRKKMAIVIMGPLVLALLGGGFYLFGDRYVSTDNAYIKAEKTSISPEISGKIIKVDIKDNTRVSKGQELFVIDPEPFQIAVNHAEANMNNVRTEIESLRSDYQQKMAELAGKEESVRYYDAETKRYQALAAKSAASKEKSDAMYHEFLSAQKDRDAAKQEAESLKAQLGGNPDIPVEEHPRYMQAKTELEKAQLDLSRIRILAPSDGVAANVNMEPGEYTATGLPLFTLVNDHDLWIEANFKETDLTYVRAGQSAEIEVDTYPGVTWHATVTSVTPATGAEFSILPPQNSSGNWVKVVQRIMVRLELADNEGKPPLAAGMSSLVTIDTGSNRLERVFGLNAQAKE